MEVRVRGGQSRIRSLEQPAGLFVIADFTQRVDGLCDLLLGIIGRSEGESPKNPAQ